MDYDIWFIMKISHASSNLRQKNNLTSASSYYVFSSKITMTESLSKQIFDTFKTPTTFMSPTTVEVKGSLKHLKLLYNNQHHLFSHFPNNIVSLSYRWRRTIWHTYVPCNIQCKVNSCWWTKRTLILEILMEITLKAQNKMLSFNMWKSL